MLPTMIPVLALSVPYLAWNVLAFGHLMPISGMLKSSLSRLTFSPSFFGSPTRVLLVVIAAGGIGAFFGLLRPGASLGGPQKRNEALMVVLAVGALLHAAYTLFAMHWGVFQWHFAFYAVPFLFVLAQWAILVERSFAVRPTAARWFAAASLAVLLLAPAEVLWKFRGKEVEGFTVASYRAALWARDHLPGNARFGMKDSGAFAYFSERRVTNLDGIINNYVYQSYLKRGELAVYIRDQGLQYIAQPAMSYNWPKADTAGYGAIAFRLPRDPQGGTFPLAERNEVYRSRWGDPQPTHFVIWRVE